MTKNAVIKVFMKLAVIPHKQIDSDEVNIFNKKEELNTL